MRLFIAVAFVGLMAASCGSSRLAADSVPPGNSSLPTSANVNGTAERTSETLSDDQPANSKNDRVYIQEDPNRSMQLTETK